MKRLKHRKEKSKEPIWQHAPKLWHPSNTRPRHYVLFAVNRALNQSWQKILNLLSSLCGSRETCATLKDVFETEAFAAVLRMNSFPSSLPPLLLEVHGPPFRPRHFRTDSAIWAMKGCRMLPVAIISYSLEILALSFVQLIFLLREDKTWIWN